MTLPHEAPTRKEFVRTVLPWAVGAGAFIVYLITLNHWVTFNGFGQGNLLQVARTSGWIWQPELYGPINWLVTYPIRWLPAKSVPVALNLLAAFCAALTLTLLARSVALLPHDRTHDQRQLEKSEFSLLSLRTAWLPSILAVLVCGLQLTFWEDATSASSLMAPWGTGLEMLDVLLFAYVIRCLLEFRTDQSESWLTRAAFVCGLGMTNSWAMIAFFPLLMVALVWLKGLAFFNGRFLLRLFLWGLAGLSLYLLLPLVQSLANIAPVPFWTAFKINLGSQKGIIMTLLAFFKASKQDALLLALTSLIPLLVISIRWASYFGDTSRLGVALTTMIFHLVHAVFLLVCIWVAFDPPFSPRGKGLSFPFSSLSFLTRSYLGALCIGYFSGYFLLLFGPTKEDPRRTSPLVRYLNLGITGAVWLIFILAPTLLVYRNLPHIRLTNGSFFEHYASLVSEGLPSRGSVVLSDDPQRLFLAQAAVAKRGDAGKFLFIDTASLQWPDYHRFLKKQYGRRWLGDPTITPKELVDPIRLINVLLRLSDTNAISYLHPSFGFYFEVFYPEAHGLVYRLTPYSTNMLFSPVPSKELIEENESFWARAENYGLRGLVAATAPTQIAKGQGLLGRTVDLLHLKDEPNREAAVLGAFYSRALDYWGVEMQRAGRLTEAAAHFERAQDLNPENIVARLNLECNKHLQAGEKPAVQVSKSIEDEFGKYRNWEQVMNANGPFDEPNFCYEQGRLLAKTGLLRESAQQFDRVKELAPDHLPSRLLLAQIYLVSGMPDAALKLVDEIRANPDRLAVPRTNQMEMMLVESSAHLAKNDLPGAELAVKAVLAKNPTNEDLIANATQTYMKYGYFTNAMELIDYQLKLTPDNASALVNKGFAYLQLKQFDQAIPPLTRALSLETNDTSALLNRAIAYLRSERLDESQRDYETLQKTFPTAYQIYYGLQEIAYLKQNTNAAIQYCELYLSNTATNTDEANLISDRLKELKSGRK